MKAQIFVFSLAVLFLATSVAQAATSSFLAPRVICTFSPAAEKYDNSIYTYFDSYSNTTISMIMLDRLENKDAIREICSEPIPDALLRTIKDSNYCQVTAPGKQYTGTGTANLLDGWSYYCNSNNNRVPPHPGSLGYPNIFDIFFVTLILLPMFFIVFPLLFIFWVAAYGILSHHRKQRMLNWYILPLFFGIIGGIVAVVGKRKKWKEMIGIGIIATFVMFLVILSGFMPVTSMI